MRDRQRGLASFGDNLAQRGEGDVGTALHVADSGAVGRAVLQAERHAVQRTQRVHRVEMRHHQDALLTLGAPGAAHHQVVAEAVPARNAPHAGAKRLGLRCHLRHQCGDRIRRIGRRLVLDPDADAGQQCVRVELGHDVLSRGGAVGSI